MDCGGGVIVPHKGQDKIEVVEMDEDEDRMSVDGKTVGSVEVIPDDVMREIVASLEAKDLSVLSQVNIRFRDLCSETGLWRDLCSRDFGVRDGNRDIYLQMMKKTNCWVNFRHRRPAYTGFDAVHVGRGVRYNEYDNSSYNFIYPAPSGALFLVFSLPVVPEHGLVMSVKHKEFYLRDRNFGFGAYIDILVNDCPLLNRYSPGSEEYVVETFEIPSDNLRWGRNTVRWNYGVGSCAFYWIQEVHLRTERKKPAS